MVLIIGGRASGKRDVALKRFGLEAQAVSPEKALHTPCIDQFHEIIRQLLARGEDSGQYVEKLMQQNPEAIILCDEIGMGIVPLSRDDRAWREAVGRACCRIAAQASQVIRVVCGLEQQLK
mgnify:FL=1